MYIKYLMSHVCCTVITVYICVCMYIEYLMSLVLYIRIHVCMYVCTYIEYLMFLVLQNVLACGQSHDQHSETGAALLCHGQWSSSLYL